MYPMLLDLRCHVCLIVGGGAVASRKAAGLIEGGAVTVRAVSPDFCHDFPESVDRIFCQYDACHLDGVAIVFAATNCAQVNDAIVRDARLRHIFVNRADASDEVHGDFVTPACWREGAALVAVSGGSAALSTRIRNNLQSHWEPIWSEMVAAMQVLRPEIRRLPDEATRRVLFRRLADDEAMNVLSDGGIDALRSWIQSQSIQ